MRVSHHRSWASTDTMCLGADRCIGCGETRRLAPLFPVGQQANQATEDTDGTTLHTMRTLKPEVAAVVMGEFGRLFGLFHLRSAGDGDSSALLHPRRRATNRLPH